jgi:replicative DNA helicase
MQEWYEGRVWLYDQHSNKIEDIFEKAISVTRKYGVKIWLLDNMSAMDLGENENNALQKQKDLINEANRLAKLYNVLVILIAHPRKLPAGQEIEGDDVGGSGSLGNLSQYMLSIKRFSERDKKGEPNGKGGWKFDKEPIKEDAEIDVIKNRYTGKVGKARVFFNYKSYRFFNDREELFRRYKWDKNSSPLPKLEDEEPRLANPEFMRD